MLFNNLRTYFYVRPSTCPGKRGVLYLRVLANKQILLTSPITHVQLFKEEFDVSKQRPKPECVNGLACTMFMNVISERLNVMHLEYEKKGMILSKQAVQAALPGIYAKSTGEVEAVLTLPKAFDEYLADQKRQVGTFIAKNTYNARTRYKAIFDKVLSNLNLFDKPLTNFTEDDVKDIQLRFIETHAKGTVIRAMFFLSAIFEYSIKSGQVTSNPVNGVKKLKMDEHTDLVWLDPEELAALTNLELSGREEEFRDAFLFCCWTGLAIGDYQMMNPKNSALLVAKAESPKNIEPAKIMRTKEGLILCGRRRKTGTKFRVPFTPEAQRILAKYGGTENMPYNLVGNGTILNIFMRMIGVQKTIRFHTARKTFANYLLNERMINPVYVIEMMGWKKIEEASPYVQIKESSLYRALSSAL